MSRRVTALALICFSSGALALSPMSVDNRMPIRVSPSERNHILFEMRDYLHGLFNLHNALASQDMKAFATSIEPMGGLLEHLPGNLKDRLPEEFTQIAIGMNEVIKVMARDAQTRGDMSLTQSQMAELMTYCSGCHDTFRFEVIPARARRQ